MRRFGTRRIFSRIIITGVVMTLTATFVGSTANAGNPVAGGNKSSVVSDWNAIAVATAVGDTSKAPAELFLYLGFVQAAVYDAAVGIEGRYEPYRFDDRAPRGSSVAAAVAAAAHRILETYFPYAQTSLDADLAASLSTVSEWCVEE